VKKGGNYTREDIIQGSMVYNNFNVVSDTALVPPTCGCCNTYASCAPPFSVKKMLFREMDKSPPVRLLSQ
jgi:hypothetical protein